MTDRDTFLKELLLKALPLPPEQPDLDAIDQILLACRVACEEEAPNNAEHIYKICHAVAKQYKLYPAMRAMMKQKWNAESMRDMSSPALKDLFYYMRCMEHIKKRF